MLDFNIFDLSIMRKVASNSTAATSSNESPTHTRPHPLFLQHLSLVLQQTFITVITIDSTFFLHTQTEVVVYGCYP